mgnify:FL=1
MFFNPLDNLEWPTLQYSLNNIPVIISFKSQGDSYDAFVFYKETLIFTFTDTLSAPFTQFFENDFFNRTFDNKTIFYENQFSTLITNKNYEFIKPKFPVKLNGSTNFNFVVMDFETILINNVHTPFALGIFSQLGYQQFISNHISFDSVDQSFIELAFNYLFSIDSFNNSHVYFHNFSRFDAFLLLPTLIKLGTVEPVVRDGKIIFIKFISMDRKFSFTFNDSYLILPSSLRDLTKSFGIKSKYFFPWEFFIYLSFLFYFWFLVRALFSNFNIP